ncbi:hypothetical protein O4G98_07355 [Zoogloeaceae bacterium G21618-S1]|nr:hypothetical protein [Zoogloeaceae bacterium G21618-S1]
MATVQFIEKFCEHFGEDRAKKFVLALHQRSKPQGRLQFWQESMIEEFCSLLGMEPLDLNGALSSFNFCPIHHCELLEDVVSIQYGTQKPPAQAEVEHALNTYPFASMVKYGPCWVEAATKSHVVYCPACREALRSENA